MNNVVVSYFVLFHAAQKPWNGLIIRLQAPKSFDPCRRSLYQALEMTRRKSKDSTRGKQSGSYALPGIKWDRYQQKKSFHSNVSSRRDQGCSHSRSGDLPPSWEIWNTNMATQISREICDVMGKRSIILAYYLAKRNSHKIGLQPASRFQLLFFYNATLQLFVNSLRTRKIVKSCYVRHDSESQTDICDN